MQKKLDVRSLAVTAIMGALGFILMLLEVSIPIMPAFIKLDFSELPAIITAFSLGPIWGGAVCLIKNLLHLFVSSTAGVGELANFLLGVLFVVPAGIFYKKRRTRNNALIAMLIGSAAMAVFSVFLNYFIVYPIYSVLLMPKEVILSFYQELLFVDNLFEALLIFNLPFNFAKGVLDSVICFAVYKHLSPILKSKR